MSNAAEFVLDENVLTKYAGSDAVVEIPEGVTVIGAGAFKGNKTMTDLVMPDSVVKIERNAFERCVKLKNVTFSQNLEESECDGCADCKVLKEVHLPDSLRYLGGGTFAGCVKLQTVTCNSQVFEMGSSPFSDFHQSAGKQLADENGLIVFCGILYDAVEHKSELVIPQGVTKIANGIFRKNTWEHKEPLKKVVLPDTVTYIGSAAFAGRSELEEINLFPGITLGENVFSGCNKLADEHGFLVVDGTAVAYYGDGGEVNVPEGITELRNNLFACRFEANPGNLKIHTVNLPESLRKIGAGAFNNCKKLENIRIPAGVEEIGSKAFQDCISLQNSHIADHVPKLGEGVFIGCKKMADENGFVIVGGSVQCFFGVDRELVIPEGVTAIESGTFCKTGIRSISLPSTLRRLGMAFRDCNMLESIRIPEGVTEIEEDTFKNCERLRDVTLPSTLVRIGRYAFSGCEDLAQIRIPDTVTEIGAGAFSGCKNLRSVKIPEGVKVLRYETFSLCDALEQVTLNQGLEKIDNQVFRCCVNLKELTLPASVKELAFGSFWNCTALKKLEYTGTELDVDRHAFDECSSLADEKGMLILANTLWKYTGNGGHVIVPEGVTTLADDVFREGAKGMGRGRSYHRREGSLTGVTLPATLCRIGNGAFAGCVALQQVEIPAGVVFVGEEAFERCKALTAVSLPAGLSGVGKGAFRGCESLTRVQLPEGTEYISAEQFKNCTGLTEISVPATVTHMGEDVFRGCSSLQTIAVHAENPVFSSEAGVLYSKAGDELLYYPGGKHLVTTAIGEKVTAIGRGAFVDCTSLKNVKIPAHVAKLGDEVFPRKSWAAAAVKLDIEVEPGAGSGGVGANVFDIEQWDNPLVYPKLPVTFVKEQTTQVCLGLGFCMNPDQYEGEYRAMYEKYALSHQKTLLKKATSMKLTAVKDYFSKTADDNPVSGKVKKVNYRKLSDTAKVELLERVILERDVEQLKAVLEGCKTFELTARALGIACCYGTPEIVGILVEFGANFVFEVTPALKRKYGVAYGTTYSSYKADYDLMVAKTNTNPYITTLFASSNSYHFGALPAIDANPMEQTRQAEIAAYLLEKNCQGFQASLVLYYAILWGNRPVAEVLLAKGVKLPAWAEVVLVDPSPVGWGVERSELLASLPALPVSECIYALTTFSNCLKEKNLKIQLTQKAFENNSKTFGDAQVLKCILELTDTTKLTKSKLLEAAVDKDSVEALDIMVSSGWLKTAAQREKLISYAAEQKKTAVLAWLIDYKNRTVDMAAEAAKKEARMMRELMEDPNSVSALKKIWGYKKLADGTLEITGYKGEGGDVVIPAMIGKGKVTSIAEDAFSASEMNGRIKNRDARKKITSVVIPEGVTTIGRTAFFQCESLHTVTIPETVTHIGTVAFRYCKKLRNINLPAGIQSLGRGIFWDCPNMYDNRGFTVVNGILLDCVGDRTEVKIPEGVTRIGAEVFKINASWDKKNSIRSVVLPESLKVIEDSAFEGMKNLSAIVIPAGVHTIGNKAFYGTGLESITFNGGLQTIGEAAFANTSLVEIKLPATVTAIGKDAFRSCGKLRDLYIPGDKVELGMEILGTYDTGSTWGRPSGIYVHTPADSQVAEYMQQYSGVFFDSENLQ